MSGAKECQLTSHLTTNFDPSTYISSLYGARCYDDEFVKFILDSLHYIYSKECVTGEKMLDIGTGPVVGHVFSASRKFKDVYLSDVSHENLAVLQKWKSGDVINQEDVFKYILNLQGSQEDWISSNKRLADQVKAIVHLDLHRDDLEVGTAIEGQLFDAISLCLCQNAASSNVKLYTNAVQRYSRLLKPGGHIVVVDTLRESYYTIGEHSFEVLKATEEMLKSVYTSSGFEILYWKEKILQEAHGVFSMLAKKTK